ncbi:NAD dependent epimerase/dehydratase family protein [Metarhizium robertsii]|uniref:Ergot alkaloid biosynthesis protein n=2 Tax=Metarhizium robertsii TaxID=568076 RepID=E9F388_METRA|nr:Ergot alkaloid biosynthesis protein [Metarhizium robertsii ARSEF 23]EFY97954.2 Ergot alkaloid biosynthesis protein [Metarhizium robertsii ARSEF 23]EXU97512.1 NAD dependent epimerase/dehydratase family protein [Metarhizium robertsii]
MTILLTGGRGKTASHIAALLDAANLPFAIASRSCSHDSKYRQLRFDWLDDTTYDNVLSPKDGMQPISAVWLVPPPIADLAPPVNAFINHARLKDVKRFVLLSASMLERGAPAMGQIHEHLASMEGIHYTVLRPTWFMENFSSPHEFQCKAIRKEDKIYSAAENGKVPFISVVDIARVAFRALKGDVEENIDPILLGPELLTYDDVAETLSKQLNRKINHVRLEESELAEKMHEYGMPLEDAQMHASMDLIVRAGGEERLNKTVLELTGTTPRTFQEFASSEKDIWLLKN